MIDHGGIVVDSSIVCESSFDSILWTAHCWHKRAVVVTRDFIVSREHADSKGMTFYPIVMVKQSRSVEDILSHAHDTVDDLLSNLIDSMPSVALPGQKVVGVSDYTTGTIRFLNENEFRNNVDSCERHGD
jgi:hypothetical protein